MPPNLMIRLGLLLFSAAFLTAGCGSSGPFATDPGENVLVDDATAFSVAQSGGGFPRQLPQGAACDPGYWTYTVHLDTSQFDWDRCDVSGATTDPTSYMHATGSRVLSATELASARAAADMVHVSGRSICGADKPTVHMTVSSAAGSKSYGDDFYSCTKQDPVYVISEELDALIEKLRLIDQQS